ncbi:MAG: AAA family ATPase, partial [Myxococcales bacterium]|nr:AAA family ATPase [Myxococcales bacterium]
MTREIDLSPAMQQAVHVPGFHGRERELALLLDRAVGSRESTLVVGEFPCGKGTLLRELGRRLDVLGYRRSFIEAQTLPSGAVPQHFWARVLPQFGAEVAACEYRDIERALYASAEDGPPVLMIDDLHTLVHLPGFASPDLWGMLRAFTQAKALTLVCTSNVDLVELTDRTKTLTLGSPFFNAMRELVLGPLGEAEVA